MMFGFQLVRAIVLFAVVTSVPAIAGEQDDLAFIKSLEDAFNAGEVLSTDILHNGSEVWQGQCGAIENFDGKSNGYILGRSLLVIKASTRGRTPFLHFGYGGGSTADEALAGYLYGFSRYSGAYLNEVNDLTIDFESDLYGSAGGPRYKDRGNMYLRASKMNGESGYAFKSSAVQMLDDGSAKTAVKELYCTFAKKIKSVR